VLVSVGVGVMEGVGVMLGMGVMVGVGVIVGVRVIVGVGVTEGVGGTRAYPTWRPRRLTIAARPPIAAARKRSLQPAPARLRRNMKNGRRDADRICRHPSQAARIMAIHSTAPMSETV
jgi:hypothetical protein